MTLNGKALAVGPLDCRAKGGLLPMLMLVVRAGKVLGTYFKL